MEPPICKNIRSRRIPDQRCPNPAIIGEYCGIHNKHPRPFINKSIIPSEIINLPINSNIYSKKIKRWLLIRSREKKRRRQGPSFIVPEISNNTTDFYSMEDIISIKKSMLFSFIDEDNKVYSFDVRSLSALLEKKTEKQFLNPYTRQFISDKNIQKAIQYIRWCRKKGIDTRWEPIQPDTPDQIFQLKVTDLFQKIDELNYYTDTTWFIGLNINHLRRFYVELYDIWYHRAGLSNEQRNLIIPTPARPFRYSIKEIIGLKNLSILQKINLDLMRMFISAASDISDRSLGAMYILTALTLVNSDCAASYPWLFDSASPGVYSNYIILEEAELPAMNLITAILNGNAMYIPPLNLF